MLFCVMLDLVLQRRARDV